jgi:hypothetical protein
VARRTIDKPTEEQAEQLSLPLPQAGRRRDPARVFAIAFLAAVTLAAAYFIFLWQPPKREAAQPPATENPPAQNAAPAQTSGPALAPLTIDAFAALPKDQQAVELKKILEHYDERGSDASRTLDPGPLYEVTTGPQLDHELKLIEGMRQAGVASDGKSDYTILRWIVGAPLHVVQVDVEVNARWWDVDPKTGARLGAENQSNGVKQSIALIEEAGVWKVSTTSKGGIFDQPAGQQ